jgi:hypothetical protein
MSKRILLAAALAACTDASARELDPHPTPIAVDTERAGGPAALERLLAQYDKLPAGAEREALALRIDRVAAQRYATESRMYWYTDMAAAIAAAQAEHKPILSLRMLGRLDEDLSCANSRYFRIALYANRELSKFLREHFVLHWSSERPAPRITVDLGDGRKLERTITGNSVHYVLDETGRPIDALPGLYAPAVFRSELETSLALLASLRGKTGYDWAHTVAEHHRLQLGARHTQWQTIGSVQVPRDQDGFRPEAFGQMFTITKSGYEMQTYRVVGLGVNVGKLPDDAQVWAQIGLRLMPHAVPAATQLVLYPRPGGVFKPRSYYSDPSFTPRRLDPEPPIAVGEILDDASRALLARLGPLDWTAVPAPANQQQLAQLVNRFERDILADTAMNEFQTRQIVRGHFTNMSEPESFAALDAFVYGSVFAMSADDPWAGLRPAGVLALPHDGLVVQH